MTRKALALVVLLVSFMVGVGVPSAAGAVATVRTSYDYEATYGPLPAQDQGQAPACWYYEHALGLIAADRMHSVTTPGWRDPAYPAFYYTGGRGWTLTYAGARHSISEELGAIPNTDPAAMRSYLDRAGFATLDVRATPSLFSVWGATSMPTIYPKPSDVMQGWHGVFVDGYTPAGLIVHNSWGWWWGYNGRAILSWSWIKAWGWRMVEESYDGYPLLGATRTPVTYGGAYTYHRVLRLASPLMSGADVRHLQRRLSFSVAAANGKFSLYTRRILARRQRALGLPATGVLDAVSARLIG